MKNLLTGSVSLLTLEVVNSVDLPALLNYISQIVVLIATIISLFKGKTTPKTEIIPVKDVLKNPTQSWENTPVINKGDSYF